MKYDEIMVSINCLAYNHELYIKKCLDSLIMQKTNFKYEVLVHDDASTDNTAEIIRAYEKKYPDIIKPIYQTENQYSKGVAITLEFQYPRARGKYIAICEGDDFWTDDTKLQKQIDFLETNSEYVLCGHAAYYADGKDLLSKDKFFSNGIGDRELTTGEIISNWAMATNTMVFRKSVRGGDPIPYKGNAFNGDYALMTYLSLQGKVFYIDKLMSAYRVQSSGSLNDIWRKDRNKRLDSEERLIGLLERFNKYSDYKYDNVVVIKQAEVLHRILWEMNTLQEYRYYKKNYKNIYKKISIKKRIKLNVRLLFPVIYSNLKNILNKIN